MSTEKLVGALAKRIGRRKFLVKMGTGFIGGLLALVGAPRLALATVQYGCCNLCNWPSSCSGCNCTWCWTCCDTTVNQQLACCECFSTNPPCGKTCNGVTCSYVINEGGCPSVPSTPLSMGR